MRTLRALTVATVIALALLLSAGGASASCAEDDRSLEQRIDDAPVVLVGTADEVTNRNRTAILDVHEIWKRTGDVPEIGSEVVVHGGPEGADEGTSVDRTWGPGQRYLVFPRVEDGRFVDDSCTSTRRWTAELADARPADTREVDEEGDLDDVAAATSTPWVVIGVTVLAAGAAAFVVARRR